MQASHETLHRTPLYALHVELGAKIVPFAGYEMPVQYPAGILKEHLHTRDKAGLFDVSHMGQAFLHGTDPARAMETLAPSDFVGLKEGMQRYGLLLNDAGGIKDDFMLTRLKGEAALYLVVNAAMKDSDFAYIAERLKGQVNVEMRPDRALLALQGPRAEAVLEKLSPGIAALTFMRVTRAKIAGIDAIVSRTGYTGEDGFEISIQSNDAERLARLLLADPDVLPIGLGARDSLRLEAGLCLYGHDIDETTDPADADLGWAIGKRRKLEKGFLAADAIMAKLFNGAAKKRVGIRPEGKAPARDGTEIADKEGRIIGKITSGGFSPSLNAPIAMGYVETAYAADGTEIDLMVRGKALPARIAPMPFVPHRYKRGAAQMSETRYTDQHEWVRIDGDEGTVGITRFATEQLGDVVFVDLPSTGKTLAKGGEAAVVESVKAASEVYAPVSGTVTAINDTLEGDPALVNAGPEEGGWFFKLKLSNKAELEALMTEDKYQEYVKGL